MENFEDILPDEEEREEEQAPQEGETNRTFIILVAALGGLLVLAIGAFVAWAVFIAPNMRAHIESQNEAILATNTAVAVAVAETETAAAIPPTATDTPEPTDTPVPTETPTPLPPTDTPEPEPTATLLSGTLESEGAVTDGSSETASMPDTGVGVLAGVVLAGGLVFVLILVRRLRRTA
jgi:hypothetical protein